MHLPITSSLHRFHLEIVPNQDIQVSTLRKLPNFKHYFYRLCVIKLHQVNMAILVFSKMSSGFNPLTAE
jgi:hypothetical protein